jgi:hypothetical protein
MVSRTTREFKAQSTHVAAMKIIEAEQKQRQLKTDRLRKLRMATQVEAKVDHVSQKAK